MIWLWLGFFCILLYVFLSLVNRHKTPQDIANQNDISKEAVDNLYVKAEEGDFKFKHLTDATKNKKVKQGSSDSNKSE